MHSNRLFLDIRFYESDKEDVLWPQNTGSIFFFPKSIGMLGARIARKLREYGFIAGDYDHLYVNFSSCSPNRKIKYSSHPKVDPRIQYVELGAIPSEVNMLTEKELENFVLNSTFDILCFVANEKPKLLEVIEKVRLEIIKKGNNLEVLHKIKETKSYKITISYTIQDRIGASTVFLEYHDKKTSMTRKIEVLKLEFYEDIFSLIGSIVVSGNKVTLKPRESFHASLQIKKYQVPIFVDLDTLFGT